MNKVILDPNLRAALKGANPSLELCDEGGQTLGYLVSPEMFKEMMLAWADARISPEELQRRRQQPGGRTLPEIWQRLGRS